MADSRLRAQREYTTIQLFTDKATATVISIPNQRGYLLDSTRIKKALAGLSGITTLDDAFRSLPVYATIESQLNEYSTIGSSELFFLNTYLRREGSSESTLSALAHLHLARDAVMSDKLSTLFFDYLQNCTSGGDCWSILNMLIPFRSLIDDIILRRVEPKHDHLHEYYAEKLSPEHYLQNHLSCVMPEGRRSVAEDFLSKQFCMYTDVKYDVIIQRYASYLQKFDERHGASTGTESIYDAQDFIIERRIGNLAFVRDTVRDTVTHRFYDVKPYQYKNMRQTKHVYLVVYGRNENLATAVPSIFWGHYVLASVSGTLRDEVDHYLRLCGIAVRRVNVDPVQTKVLDLIQEHVGMYPFLATIIAVGTVTLNSPIFSAFRALVTGQPVKIPTNSRARTTRFYKLIDELTWSCPNMPISTNPTPCGTCLSIAARGDPTVIHHALNQIEHLTPAGHLSIHESNPIMVYLSWTAIDVGFTLLNSDEASQRSILCSMPAMALLSFLQTIRSEGVSSTRQVSVRSLGGNGVELDVDGHVSLDSIYMKLISAIPLLIPGGASVITARLLHHDSDDAVKLGAKTKRKDRALMQKGAGAMCDYQIVLNLPLTRLNASLPTFVVAHNLKSYYSKLTRGPVRRSHPEFVSSFLVSLVNTSDTTIMQHNTLYAPILEMGQYFLASQEIFPEDQFDVTQLCTFVEPNTCKLIFVPKTVVERINASDVHDAWRTLQLADTYNDAERKMCSVVTDRLERILTGSCDEDIYMAGRIMSILYTAFQNAICQTITLFGTYYLEVSWVGGNTRYAGGSVRLRQQVDNPVNYMPEHLFIRKQATELLDELPDVSDVMNRMACVNTKVKVMSRGFKTLGLVSRATTAKHATTWGKGTGTMTVLTKQPSTVKVQKPAVKGSQKAILSAADFPSVMSANAVGGGKPPANAK